MYSVVQYMPSAAGWFASEPRFKRSNDCSEGANSKKTCHVTVRLPLAEGLRAPRLVLARTERHVVQSKCPCPCFRRWIWTDVKMRAMSYLYIQLASASHTPIDVAFAEEYLHV